VEAAADLRGRLARPRRLVARLPRPERPYCPPRPSRAREVQRGGSNEDEYVLAQDVRLAVAALGKLFLKDLLPMPADHGKDPLSSRSGQALSYGHDSGSPAPATAGPHLAWAGTSAHQPEAQPSQLRSRTPTAVRTWEANDPDFGRPIAGLLDQCSELFGIDIAAIAELAATRRPRRQPTTKRDRPSAARLPLVFERCAEMEGADTDPT